MKGVCRAALNRMPTTTKKMPTTNHEQCKPIPKRPTQLQFISGILALALACFSLLCFFFYKAPAHASSGYIQTNEKTMSGQVAFDDTETDTPSQTVTTSPSSTVTKTSTPIPSPSETRTSTRSPTSTRTSTSTTRPSSAARGKQTQSPVQMSLSNAGQGSGGNQPQIVITAPTNYQGNQSNKSGNHSGHSIPISSLIIFLGSIILLGSLVKAWWMFLRGRGLPRRTRKWSPSGAPVWSRTRISEQHNSIVTQRAFDLATFSGGVLTSDQEDLAIQRGAMSQAFPLSSRSGLTNTESVSLLAGATKSNLRSHIYPGVPRPVALITHGGNLPVSFNAIPPITDVPVTNQPAFSSLEYALSTAAYPLSKKDSYGGIDQMVDLSSLVDGEKLSRNAPHITDSLPALQGQSPEEHSVDNIELSDEGLRTTIQSFIY
jgi:hypothetical protein